MSFTIVSVDAGTGTVTTNNPDGGAVAQVLVSINGVIDTTDGDVYVFGGNNQTTQFNSLRQRYNTTIFLVDVNAYYGWDGINPQGTILPLSAPFTVGPPPVLDSTAITITNITIGNVTYNSSYGLPLNFKLAKVIDGSAVVIPNSATFTSPGIRTNRRSDIYENEFNGYNSGDTIVFVSASDPTFEVSNRFVVPVIIDTTRVDIITNQFTINTSNYDPSASVYLNVNGTPYVNGVFNINKSQISSNQIIDVSELTGVSLLGGSDVITIDACGTGLTVKTLQMLVPLVLETGPENMTVINNTENNISVYMYYEIHDRIINTIDSSAILTTAVEIAPGMGSYNKSMFGLIDPVYNDMKFQLVLADGTNRKASLLSPFGGGGWTARPNSYAEAGSITINSFDLSLNTINITATKNHIQLFFYLVPVNSTVGVTTPDLSNYLFTAPSGTSDVNFNTITGFNLNDFGGFYVLIYGLQRHPTIQPVINASSTFAEIPIPTISILSADSTTGTMVVQSSGGYRFCRVIPATQNSGLPNPIPGGGPEWNTNNIFEVNTGLNTINYVNLLGIALDFSLYVMIRNTHGTDLTTPRDLAPPPTPTPTQITINSFDICNNTISLTSTYGGPFPARLEVVYNDVSFNTFREFTLHAGTRSYAYEPLLEVDRIKTLAERTIRVLSSGGWGNLTQRDYGARYVSNAATAPPYPTLGDATITSTTADNKIVIVSTYATPFTAYLDTSGSFSGINYRKSPMMTINPGTNTITNTYQQMNVGAEYWLRAAPGWGYKYLTDKFTVTVQGSLPAQPVHIDALGDNNNDIYVVSQFRYERAYLRITNNGTSVSYNMDASSYFVVPENPTAGQPGYGTMDFVGTLFSLTGITQLIDSVTSTIAVHDADSDRRISNIFRRSGETQRTVTPPLAGDIRITNVDRTGIYFDSSNNILGALLLVNGTPIQPPELESGMGGLFVNWGRNQFASRIFTSSAQVQFIRPVPGGASIQISNAYNFVLGSEHLGVASMVSATAQSGNVVFTSSTAISAVKFGTRSPTGVETVRPGSFPVVIGTNTIPYASRVTDGTTLTDLSGHLIGLVLAENDELLVSMNSVTVIGLPVNQVITPVNESVTTTLSRLINTPTSVTLNDIQAAISASPANIQITADTTAVSALGDRALLNQRNNPNNVIVASQDGTLKLRSINIASAAAKDVSIAVKKVNPQTFNINLTKIDASGNKVSGTIGDASTYDTLVVEIPTPPSLVLTINHIDNSGIITPLFTGIDLGALPNNGTYTNPSNQVTIQRLFANANGSTIRYSITGPFSQQNQVFVTTTITNAVLSTNTITYDATGDVSGAVQLAINGTVIPGSSTFTVVQGTSQTINFQGITGVQLGTYADQSLTMVMAGSGSILTSAAYTIPSLPVPLTSTSFVIENFDLSNNTFQLTSTPLVAYDISAYISTDSDNSIEFNVPAFISPYTVNFGAIMAGAPNVATQNLTLYATAAYGGIAISAQATAPAFPGAGAVTLNSYNAATNVLNATSSYASTFTATLTDASSNTTSSTFSVPNGTNDINVSGLSLALTGGVLTMSATSSYGSAVVSNTLIVSPPPAPEPLTSSSFTISNIDISNNTFRITPASSVVYDVSAVIKVTVSTSPLILLSSSAFHVAAHPATTTINYGTVMGGGARIAGKTFQLFATEAFGNMAISASATAPNYPGSSAVTLNSFNVNTNVLNVNSMYGSSFTAVLTDSSGNATSAPFTVPTSLINSVNITVSGLSLASTGGVLTMYATPSYNSGVVSNTLTVSAVVPPSPPAPTPPNTSTGNVICVCAGTMIMTPTGERAVESLSAGDLIVASDGRKLPIVSLHNTEVASCSAKNAPYVIKAGAFGRGLPHTDLAVSPLHALQVRAGQWMIPSMTTDPSLRAKMARYAEGQATTYYHLELPNYLTDNFIANGVVSESNGLPWQLRNAVPQKVYSQMRNGYFTRAAAAAAPKPKTAKKSNH